VGSVHAGMKPVTHVQLLGGWLFSSAGRRLRVWLVARGIHVRGVRMFLLPVLNGLWVITVADFVDGRAMGMGVLWGWEWYGDGSAMGIL